MSSTKHFKITYEKAFILGFHTTSNHKGTIAVNILTLDTNHLKLFEVQVSSVHLFMLCMHLIDVVGWIVFFLENLSFQKYFISVSYIYVSVSTKLTSN